MKMLEIKMAGEFPVETLMDVMNRSFAGYLAGSIQFTVPAFWAFLARDNTSLSLSQVALQDGVPVGLALVARQGWTSRLAAMGVVPEAKGQGVGSWFMRQLMEQAQKRGDKRYVLEVFEQNDAALPVYRKAGFEVVRRLYGYEHASLPAHESPDLLALDTPEVAKQIMIHGLVNLPAQMSASHVLRYAPPYEAYRLDSAYAVIVRVGEEKILLAALIVAESARQQGQATRLLAAIAAQYPNRTWAVSAICPEECESFFLKRGFIRQALNQFQMEVAL